MMPASAPAPTSSPPLQRSNSGNPDLLATRLAGASLGRNDGAGEIQPEPDPDQFGARPAPQTNPNPPAADPAADLIDEVVRLRGEEVAHERTKEAHERTKKDLADKTAGGSPFGAFARLKAMLAAGVNGAWRSVASSPARPRPDTTIPANLPAFTATRAARWADPSAAPTAQPKGTTSRGPAAKPIATLAENESLRQQLNAFSAKIAELDGLLAAGKLRESQLFEVERKASDYAAALDNAQAMLRRKDGYSIDNHHFTGDLVAKIQGVLQALQGIALFAGEGLRGMEERPFAFGTPMPSLRAPGMPEPMAMSPGEIPGDNTGSNTGGNTGRSPMTLPLLRLLGYSDGLTAHGPKGQQMVPVEWLDATQLRCERTGLANGYPEWAFLSAMAELCYTDALALAWSKVPTSRLPRTWVGMRAWLADNSVSPIETMGSRAQAELLAGEVTQGDQPFATYVHTFRATMATAQEAGAIPESLQLKLFRTGLRKGLRGPAERQPVTGLPWTSLPLLINYLAGEDRCQAVRNAAIERGDSSKPWPRHHNSRKRLAVALGRTQSTKPEPKSSTPEPSSKRKAHGEASGSDGKRNRAGGEGQSQGVWEKAMAVGVRKPKFEGRSQGQWACCVLKQLCTQCLLPKGACAAKGKGSECAKKGTGLAPWRDELQLGTPGARMDLSLA
jgi:hypothetical protein